MTMTAGHGVVFGSVMVFLLGTPGVARAQTYGEEAEQPSSEVRIEATVVREPHIRTTDPYARALLKAGAAHSATLRKLLSRLEASDVVAYVRIDTTLPGHLGGKTWFVVAAGGIRYVEILVKPADHVLSTAALLGHELAHAIEVASDAAIVDPQSMAERYLSTGIVRLGARRTWVDTDFAQKTGANVLRELMPFVADLVAAVPLTR
jgi:hypothetical protein